MIAKAFEFEYTCIVDSSSIDIELKDGTYVRKQWFENETALINSLLHWTRIGYKGVYTYFLTAENMENNKQVKALSVDIYGNLSEAIRYSNKTPIYLISNISFGYYATRK